MSGATLWVGVHAGERNGIDTYAEQIALAAASVGHQVTLLATDTKVAESLRARLHDDGVGVDHLGLEPLTPRAAWAERFWPSAMARRQIAALRAFETRKGLAGAVWHFNRPALALAVEGRAERICVAAWFYPHRALGRLRETWGHVGGPLLRRTVITAKALDFYRWDQRGYQASDWIICPTLKLAKQLRAQGHRVFACPPPARVPTGGLAPSPPNQPPRFLVCSGDLAHPRKNLADAVEALATLTQQRGPLTLVAIGRHPEQLLRLAERRSPLLRVEVLGVLEPAQVREEMQRCDALLLPSRYEEWGYVAVEALLCGAPVVTYPVYPFDEMLSGGLGSVARGPGPASYAAAIERSLTLPRGQALRQAAAARFGSAAVGERLSPIWTGEPIDNSGQFQAAHAEISGATA